MYCPKCGAPDQTAKAYCKSCGEWLPNLDAKTRHTFGGETPQQIISTNLFMSAITTLAALFSGFALYLTYLGTDDAKWSVYLAGAFCFCIGLASFNLLHNPPFETTTKKQSRKFGNASGVKQPEEFSGTNAGDMSAFVGMTSVTENSTELLNHVQSRKRDTQR